MKLRNSFPLAAVAALLMASTARADAVAVVEVVVPERERGAAVVLRLLRLPRLAAEIQCAEAHRGQRRLAGHEGGFVGAGR